jgi:nucleoside-diphosphate-sugar epimerase
MRIFVTGASGHIGSLVVRELWDHGHTVVGLARSQTSADALTSAGAQVVRGTLDDLEILADAARDADGVIHLAYKHDFSDYAASAEADVRAVEAMGAALAGSGKPFVNTSGTATLAAASPGALATEDMVGTGPRGASEAAALALAEQGVRAIVIRLSPTVHGPTDLQGFIPALIANARRTGQSIYIGDGANRWPAIDNRDAARLYRLAIESAPAGAVLHGAAEEGIPFRDIAEVIGARLGVPAVGVSPEEATEQLQFIGWVAALDNPTSSKHTQQLLGWTPEYPTLLEDMRGEHYFV